MTAGAAGVLRGGSSARTTLEGVRGFSSSDQTISPAGIGTGRSFSEGGNPHSKASV